MRFTASFVFGFTLFVCFTDAAVAQAPAGWIADRKTGCKVWNLQPQPKETIVWDGPCKGGVANGPGILQWFENGKLTQRSEGEWRKGRQEGRGLTVDAGNVRMEGEFVEGRLNGRGVVTHPDGSRIVGSFVDGQLQGRGVVTRPDGSKADADFENGEPVRGVWSLPDGSRYEGEMKNFNRHGRGKLQKSNGTVYEGEFADDEYDGYGTILFPSGDRYEGEWSGGLPNGRGTSRIKGRQNSGVWEDGCLAEEDSDYEFWSVFMTTSSECGFE